MTLISWTIYNDINRLFKPLKSLIIELEFDSTGYIPLPKIVFETAFHVSKSLHLYLYIEVLVKTYDGGKKKLEVITTFVLIVMHEHMRFLLIRTHFKS